MAIKTSLAISMGGLLVGHPNMSRTMSIIAWTTNHPIWSIIIGLLSIAVVWSIIRAIVRGIESVSVAILKTPLRLIWQAVKFIFKWLKKGFVWGWRKLTKQAPLELEPNITLDLISNQVNTQQRLSEISTRLVQIQQEQAELLQEATTLMTSPNLNHSSRNQFQEMIQNTSASNQN